MNYTGYNVGLGYLTDLFSDDNDLKEQIPLASSLSHVPRLRDWSQQLGDVLSLIKDRLTFYPHVQKFAICCKNWHLVAKLETFNSSIPLLLLTYNDPTNTLSFLNLEKSQIHNLYLSEPEGLPRWICGSTNGWLCCINYNLDLELVNPLTQAQVPLPRLDSVTTEDYHNWLHGNLDQYLKKVAIMEDPTSSPLSLLVAIIFSTKEKLGICRLGDKGWTVVSANIEPLSDHSDWEDDMSYDDDMSYEGTVWHHSQRIKDIVCHEGKVYALVKEDSVEVFDYLGPNNFRSIASMPIPTDQEDKHTCFYNGYLVKMSCGDLLYVQRYGIHYYSITRKHNPSVTKHFKIYKLSCKDIKEPWKRVTDLNGESLFVGPSNSVSVSPKTKNHDWLKPDCIYFADEGHLPSDLEGHGYELDTGVYCLRENRVVERFDIQHSLSFCQVPPMWYQQNV